MLLLVKDLGRQENLEWNNSFASMVPNLARSEKSGSSLVQWNT